MDRPVMYSSHCMNAYRFLQCWNLFVIITILLLYKINIYYYIMFSYCKILLVYQAIATNIFNAVVVVYLVLLQGL